MLIVTSPAKSLDFQTPYKSYFHTTPHFLKEADQLVNTLKTYSVKKLGKTLEVSHTLAQLNYDRFQVWNSEDKTLTRPALFAYNGDIYMQLTPETYTKAQSEYLQHSLRIISGLYGIVKAYDLIQPYRLEIKIKIRMGKTKDLYQFWGDKLTEGLNAEIEAHNHKFVVNLASNEYFDVINVKKLYVPLVTIEFNQKTNGTYKNIGFLSKKARGMMIDYMVTHGVNELDQIKEFKKEGYEFSKEADGKMLFIKK